MKRIYNIKHINEVWVIQCPDCDTVLESSSERDMLPKFSLCDCQPKYSVCRSPDSDDVYCVRNIAPRLTVKYSPGDGINNVVFTDFIDLPQPDPIELARMMRGVGEAIARFLQNEQREEREQRGV